MSAGALTPEAFERSERRSLIAEMYKRRMTQKAIVEALKKKGIQCSQPTVSRDIRIIEKHWREESVERFDAIRAREAAELDDMERDVIQDWNLSGILEEQEALYHADGRRVMHDGKPAWKTSRKRVPRDPRYLKLRLEIKTRRAKLLGLDSPEVTLDLLLAGATADLDGLTDDQLAAIIAKGGHDAIDVTPERDEDIEAVNEMIGYAEDQDESLDDYDQDFY